MSDVVRDAIAASIAALPQLVRTPDVVGYGTDLLCIADVTPRLDETDPATIESLAQDLFHRITTPRGDLPDDPDYGTDARRYLSKGMTPQDLQQAAGELAAECRKDDRVAVASVTLTSSNVGKALDITIAITPQDPDLQAFTLLIAVTDGAALLKATIL